MIPIVLSQSWLCDLILLKSKQLSLRLPRNVNLGITQILHINRVITIFIILKIKGQYLFNVSQQFVRGEINLLFDSLVNRLELVFGRFCSFFDLSFHISAQVVFGVDKVFWYWRLVVLVQLSRIEIALLVLLGLCVELENLLADLLLAVAAEICFWDQCL